MAQFDMGFFVELLEKVSGLPGVTYPSDRQLVGPQIEWEDDVVKPEAAITDADSWVGEVDIDKFRFHSRLLHEAGYVTSVLDYPKLKGWAEQTLWIPNQPHSITWAGQKFLCGVKETGGLSQFLHILKEESVKAGLTLLKKYAFGES